MTTIREDFEKTVERLTGRDMPYYFRSGGVVRLGLAWNDVWQEIHKQYDKRGRGRPPKLESTDAKTVDRYELLCKMMRLKKSPTTEAVRMVIFDGVSVAKAAEANGIKVRGVYTAVNRMKEAFSMAKIVAEQKINW
jgi:hypothetical protein